MKMISIVAGALLFFPFSSYAETIDLVCTDETGFSVNYEIDTSQSAVLSNGKSARKVYINRAEISFVIDLSGKEWFHVINRTTGNMTVQHPNKTILPSIKCERSKPKF